MARLTEQDQRDLSKALSYANWSVLGLIVPIIGFLLAGMSLSYIKTIPVTTQSRTKINQIKNVAWLGIIVSVLALMAWGGYIKYQRAQESNRQQDIMRQQNAEDKKNRHAKCLTDKSYEATVLAEQNKPYTPAMVACKYLEP